MLCVITTTNFIIIIISITTTIIITTEIFIIVVVVSAEEVAQPHAQPSVSIVAPSCLLKSLLLLDPGDFLLSLSLFFSFDGFLERRPSSPRVSRGRSEPPSVAARITPFVHTNRIAHVARASRASRASRAMHVLHIAQITVRFPLPLFKAQDGAG